MNMLTEKIFGTHVYHFADEKGKETYLPASPRQGQDLTNDITV